MTTVTNDMREQVWAYLNCAPDDLCGATDACYLFYHRCMLADMHYLDADRYAILNTMFGYDIGIENATALDEWFWNHECDIFDLHPVRDKSFIALAVAEMGLHLDFSKWLDRMYDCWEFFAEGESR